MYPPSGMHSSLPLRDLSNLEVDDRIEMSPSLIGETSCD